MSTLLRLQIGGIRSFGADDRDGQSIQFEKPFNLILGRNGCGKTTIIEALKYACTGTMPPGQGTNFVRDPKLDRQIETRAYVKLKFTNSQGKTMHIAKLMTSTQKYKKLTFATADVTTSIEENGQMRQLSGRHADSEVLVCRLLGVAKPILNYVIFCHQEESFWPLDENKKLKERFDEIFDSTKYNKCMESVRQLRKKVMAEKKLDEEGKKHLKENVDIVKQKRGELEGYERRLEDSKRDLQTLQNQLKQCSKQRDEWLKKAQNYMSLRDKQVAARNELEKLEKERDTLQNMLTHIFTGTEDELHEEIVNFKNQVNSKEESKNEIIDEIRKNDREEEKVQKLMSQVRVKIGHLQSDQKHEQRKRDERNQKLSEIAQAASVPALRTEPSEAEVDDLIADLQKYFHSLASSITLLKHSHAKEEKDLQDNIDQWLEVKTKLEAEVRQKEKAIASTDIEVESLQDKIKSVNAHRAKKQQIDRDLQKCRQDREAAVRAESPETLSREIKCLETTCQDLEIRFKGLGAELESLMKSQDIQSKMKLAREKAEELQTVVNKLKLRHKDFTCKHLNLSSDETLKQDFETLIHKWKMEVDTLQSEIAEKNRKESSLEMNRKHVKAQLDKKRNEVARNKEALFELCGKKDLDEVLQAVQKQINSQQTDKGVFDASSVMFSRYIRELGYPNPCCPLCKRGFDEDSQIADLIEDIQKTKNGLPVQIKTTTELLMKYQEKQRKLLALKPIEKSTKDLEANEIPQLEKEMADIEENLEVAKQEIPLLEASLQGTQADLRSAEAIRDDIVEIDRCRKEYKKQYLWLENFQRGNPSTNSVRTSDQALEEQQRVQEELSAKRKEKDSAERKERLYEKRINELDQKIAILMADQLKTDKLLHEEESIKTRLNELNTLKSVLEAELDEAMKKLPSALANKKRADDALRHAKVTNSKALQSKERERDEQVNKMNIILSLKNELKDFQEKNIDNALLELKVKVEEDQKKLDEIKDIRNVLNDKKNKLTALIDGHKIKENELEGNLNLMRVSRSIEEQTEVVDKLQKEVGDADYPTTVKKCDELGIQYTTLNRRIDELNGTLEVQKENIRSRQEELNHGSLRNAERKYKEKLVDYTVKDHVEKDLQKYYTAIDFAMQKFHKERMDCVNKIIRELWRLIYKGNDIDYIEIETDESATTGTASSSLEKRKTYNYRVVQDKDGTKIEMKGRCSAGQKVLACLIIRMALAETFSSNCGILTLDEPTTNLDKENIKSLCDAISRIITERESRKGFQLIVITHDLQFLKAMSHVDAFEHYWHVSRNNKSKSQIVKRPVIKS